MVLDRLASASLYTGLGPRIAQAFHFLQHTSLLQLSVGKHSIDGENLFVLMQHYLTKPVAEGRWEAHRKYLDLHLVISGAERVGFAHLDRLTAGPYEEDKDVVRLTGTGDFVTVATGSFVLLWPRDAHMPAVAVNVPAPVTKAVMKIRIDLH